VRGIFARENGQGMLFEVTEGNSDAPKAHSDGLSQGGEITTPNKTGKKPTLTIVK
jgi:stringent starvation protein B